MVCGRNTAQSQVTLRTSYEALRKDNVCLEGCAKNILHDTRLCTTRSGGAPRCTHTTSIVDFLDYVVVVGPPPPPLPATTLGLYSSFTTSTTTTNYYCAIIAKTVLCITNSLPTQIRKLLLLYYCTIQGGQSLYRLW